jgi:hypothetical protein
VCAFYSGMNGWKKADETRSENFIGFLFNFTEEKCE